MNPVEITCTNCGTKLNIPDHKIPKDKKASFLCPKCKQRLYITPDSTENTGNNGPIPGGGANEKPGSGTPDYDASERPFDYLDDDAETALICLGDAHSATHARTALEKMTYHIEQVDDVRTALTRMKYHLFNIILVDEAFDAAHSGSRILLQELKELDMGLRRQIVVVLISPKLRTQDDMTALSKSVNQIINRKDMPSHTLNLLKKGIKDHEQFYTVFNEGLKKAGKG